MTFRYAQPFALLVLALLHGCGGSADGTPRDAGGGNDTGPADGGGPIGSGESVTETIDMAGGSITLGGAELTIPPGALSAPTQITITETTDVGPAGYTRYSPVYRFEPDGTSFSQPLTIRLPYTGDASLATLFWSRSASQGGGWERVGGVVSGGYVEAEVTHFSTGFIADGVDYTETPDRSCVYTRYLDTKRQSPSNIGLFFAMDDCWGRPITDLQESELAIFEDGTQLSVEASPTLLDRRGLEIFTSLVIDMSNSTSSVLPEVILAAKDFVTGLQQSATGVRAQVSIQLFDGQATLVEWQAPTLDTTRLLTRLDALATYTSPDGSSTNLYGGVIDALSRSATAQAAFRTRNAGGAFTTGYVVLFTDGGDTSGYRTRDAVLAAIASSTDDILAVGLSSSADYNPTVLRELTSFGVIDSPNATTLSREFRRMAARIQGQARRTYLLGYCSPKRTGTSHTVSVQLAAATSNTPIGASTFDATGFAGGCTPQQFIDACIGKECGGMGCGGCDDRIEGCQAVTGQCDSFCVTAPNSWCDDRTIQNTRGYQQVCPSSPPMAVQCGSRCVDVTSDASNCGECGFACGTGGICSGGVCESSVSGAPCTNCGGACTVVSTDDTNCGYCGVRCPGAACSNGQCVNGTDPCSSCNNSALCIDDETRLTNSNECGWCDNTCVGGSTCSAGTCVTGGEACVACGSSCLTSAAYLSDSNNCGGCMNRCMQGSVCVAGSCTKGGETCVNFSGLCLTVAECASYGISLACSDDGQIRWAVPPGDSPDAGRFSTTAGVVSDSVTGLEWKWSAYPSLVNLAGSLTGCAALVLNGHDDWRPPTVLESLTIFDFSTNTLVSHFPSSPSSMWTSTPYGNGVNLTHLVYYNNSFGYSLAWSNNNMSTSVCVRSSNTQPTNNDRFSLSQLGNVVVDSVGLLSWERFLDERTFTYQGAVGYCSDLTLDGLSDWRVPTLNEAASLIDYGGSPAIDTRWFSRGEVAAIWTSTERFVEFMYGLITQQRPRGETGRVRCVR